MVRALTALIAQSGRHMQDNRTSHTEFIVHILTYPPVIIQVLIYFLVADSGSDDVANDEEQGEEKEHAAAPDDLESPAENLTACSTNATGGGDNWVESDCVSLNATALTNFGTASPKARRPQLVNYAKTAICMQNE